MALPREFRTSPFAFGVTPPPVVVGIIPALFQAASSGVAAALATPATAGAAYLAGKELGLFDALGDGVKKLIQSPLGIGFRAVVHAMRDIMNDPDIGGTVKWFLTAVAATTFGAVQGTLNAVLPSAVPWAAGAAGPLASTVLAIPELVREDQPFFQAWMRGFANHVQFGIDVLVGIVAPGVTKELGEVLKKASDPVAKAIASAMNPMLMKASAQLEQFARAKAESVRKALTKMNSGFLNTIVRTAESEAARLWQAVKPTREDVVAFADKLGVKPDEAAFALAAMSKNQAFEALARSFNPVTGMPSGATLTSSAPAAPPPMTAEQKQASALSRSLNILSNQKVQLATASARYGDALSQPLATSAILDRLRESWARDAAAAAPPSPGLEVVPPPGPSAYADVLDRGAHVSEPMSVGKRVGLFLGVLGLVGVAIYAMTED